MTVVRRGGTSHSATEARPEKLPSTPLQTAFFTTNEKHSLTLWLLPQKSNSVPSFATAKCQSQSSHAWPKWSICNHVLPWKRTSLPPQVSSTRPSGRRSPMVWTCTFLDKRPSNTKNTFLSTGDQVVQSRGATSQNIFLICIILPYDPSMSMCKFISYHLYLLFHATIRK